MSLIASVFSWVPAAVHWVVVLLPVVLLWLVHQFIGWTAVVVFGLGSFVYLFHEILYPGGVDEKKDRVTIIKEEVSASATSKKVCVIGCGPAGIVTCKEVLAEGHQVSCFEATDRVGGTFASFFWPGGKLTSSPYVTAWSDYEPHHDENGKEHWGHHTGDEYVNYMKSYADHFGVTKCIHLNHRVQHLFQSEGMTWLCVKDLKTGQERTEGPFDHVAICSGAFHSKFIPSIPGMSTFKGEILHTRDFASDNKTDADEVFAPLSNKRVVAIGMGESMSDILGIVTTNISSPTTYCAASVRSGAFIIPRTNPLTNKNNDFDSSRARYALPKWLHNLTIVVCTALTNLFEFRKSKQRRIRYELMRNLPNFGPAYVKTCKSDNFIAPIETGKIELKPAVERVDGSTVYYVDGSKSENIDVLFFGTGFKAPRFPFITESSFPSGTETARRGSVAALSASQWNLFSALRQGAPPANTTGSSRRSNRGSVILRQSGQDNFGIAALKNRRKMFAASKSQPTSLGASLRCIVPETPRASSVIGTVEGTVGKVPFGERLCNRSATKRFLRMFDPEIGSSMAFIGLGARPLVGSIPTVAELQARLFALVVSGKRELPPLSTMQDKILEDEAFARLEFGRHNEQWRVIINWIPYMDILAREIGCLPKKEWIIFRPRLALKLMFGPMCSYHYRLTGPSAKPEIAEDVLRRLPFGSRKRDMLFFLGIHLARAIIMWPTLVFTEFVLIVMVWVSKQKETVDTAAEADFEVRPSIIRPPLVRDDPVEQDMIEDPEDTIMIYRAVHGDIFRFETAAGKTTVAVCDKDLANAALKNRHLSFDTPSYQSKIRFGVKDFMTGPEQAGHLSQFFRKQLTGSSVMHFFGERFESAISTRMEDFVSGLSGTKTMSLAELVSRVVFAANVDALFGPGNLYSEEFYKDFELFSSSIGVRSASGGKRSDQQEASSKARERLLAAMHKIRTESSEAASVIKELSTTLGANEHDADVLAVLMLWGSNINMLPSNIWLLSILLNHKDVTSQLLEERAASPGFEKRPLLEAVIAEGLRLQTRPNMYRVATQDTIIEKADGTKYAINEGEWVWLFPRSYLHYNSEVYPQPESFKPFERFAQEGRCPFKAGSPWLRVFGGGTAPCPGRDYAVSFLKVVIDKLLLSGRLRIELVDPELPPAVMKTVASTPPPCRDIMVKITRT